MIGSVLVRRAVGVVVVGMLGADAGRTQQMGSAAPPAPTGVTAQQAGPATGGGQQVQMGGMSPGVPGVEKRQKADPSTALMLTVEGRSRTMTVAELEAMPQRTVTVTNGHTNAQETYTGVAVSDLLAAMGMSLAGDAHAPGSARSRLLRSFVRATGTDFYFVVFSAVELQPTMHAGDVIVATKRDGKALGDAGALMLVSSEDKQPARWVHNLQSMTLSTVN